MTTKEIVDYAKEILALAELDSTVLKSHERSGLISQIIAVCGQPTTRS